jgi:hypothetical protein
MHTWFEVKVRYDKADENGLPTKVTEPYLVDALTFTEAEGRISKEMQPYISGDFSIAAIKKANIVELFDAFGGDRWFKCRVNFIVTDMEKGTEKKVANTMYVLAEDIADALANLQKGLQGTMSDYTITNIAETQILDVFPYIEAVPANLKPVEKPDLAYAVSADE